MHKDYARYQSCKRKTKQKINNNNKKKQQQQKTLLNISERTLGVAFILILFYIILKQVHKPKQYEAYNHHFL